MSDRGGHNLPSSFKKVFVKCSPAMRAYGQCVASKVPAVERGMCSREFMSLKLCVQKAIPE
ncbi:hypothetical protein Mp_1g04390 [Marchantia polymorpha subsp. ruderalis]|uniref:IMS import disulfide relay-system CHCH-CHCH-like Cx9C domain-containing protein n=2 Tax=Marchantia polymorpha TaxID=3197 RepID=A0AAF6ALF5_MARPO|nr:hypothetical protein MARPO_0005s0168 [Marchantia polymorpha]BBM97275.1 hypothetical protein Mp_1g04390 [Marchantia polymorpha subsp. ruderalis]|eukprot:PTQ48532.1 hypothetical protein MARPO_0005s0168 [Marchantia polymorpha]